MRVLVVHSRYRQRGGEDAAVDAEIAALRAADVDVVPFLSENDAFSNRSTISAGLHALWSADTLRRLRQVVADTRPDVMHVHNTFVGLSASVYLAVQGQACRIPIIQTLHNFRLLCTNALLLRDARPCTLCIDASLPWRGIRHACYRDSRAASAISAAQAAVHRMLGARHVDRYIALSASARDIFTGAGMPADRIVIKPNVIPDPGDDAATGGPRRGLLFVGRISQEKGLDTVLAALQSLDIPLTVAGSGPAAEDLQRGAPPSVRWLGTVTPGEISQLMRRSALLVFPSLAFENYPMALAEAMAHGLPVLASDRGAMREMVQPGRTGWLADPADPAAWRARLIDLMARPDDLAAAGRAARAQYLAHMAPMQVITRQLGIYRQAIEAAA